MFSSENGFSPSQAEQYPKTNYLKIVYNLDLIGRLRMYLKTGKRNSEFITAVPFLMFCESSHVCS